MTSYMVAPSWLTSRLSEFVLVPEHFNSRLTSSCHPAHLWNHLPELWDAPKTVKLKSLVLQRRRLSSQEVKITQECQCHDQALSSRILTSPSDAFTRLTSLVRTEGDAEANHRRGRASAKHLCGLAVFPTILYLSCFLDSIIPWFSF